jgi:hypothetical protein
MIEGTYGFCLSMRETRAASSARSTKAPDAHDTRAKRSSILSVVVPADGTSAASGGNGDFGTSPILGSSRANHCLPVPVHVGC